jgi:ABC-type polysaccharide/polyol phosphate transport system ATPase subunit
MNTPIAYSPPIAQSPVLEIEPIIRFEDVAVRYRVPHERVSGIKEYTIRWLQRRLSYEEFWALQGVSFEVSQGEVFGVIGRNGAGKSTMLKIMARVLMPTRGRVVMRGRLAPLLELGAGFHPELTGRENVYLNSALLGFSRALTDGLFPSIIEFAEVGEFIDAPLRTYSTGMVARLGFSVATSVRPDILLVDEVLSVGDNRFQEKCLARMNGFRADGTTIVIVSHSMATIQSFCNRALWLDNGQIRVIGSVDQVIEQYTNR